MFECVRYVYYRTYRQTYRCTMITSRQKQILNILKNEKKVSTEKLSKSLFVCEMTIRRDLKELEQNGLIKRYNGGALVIDEQADVPIIARRLYQSKQKDLLAQKAKKYLRDNMTVFLDSSSTCGYIIPYLAKYSGIRVVTNSVQGALVLGRYGIPTILTGGNFFAKDCCVLGSLTEDN